mmetsp:Transcript_24091/g.45801  ORF Transcript_24091/g.45801 Transcript_24091/m.45801 type:complete len:234 (-) Transcript_24091:147-848(-)|eukprot:scaffold5479_cov199-Amphora_coffeaeformis.AAC.99
MPPALHHVPRCISSPIVQCLFELDVVGKPVVVVEEGFADLKTPEHLAINPMGTCPAFQDGSIILWESGAVLDYLLERYDTDYRLHPAPITPSSTPDEIAKRAKYLQLKQYVIATVYPFIASLVIHKLTKPVKDQDPEYVASATAKVNDLLVPTLTKWLGEGPYFLGTDISAVDILMAKPLRNLHQLDLLEQSPPLLALLEKVKSLPSYEKSYTSIIDTSLEARGLVLVPDQKS